MEIKDFDIATVEALHNLLFDNHGYGLQHPALKNARVLIDKMYAECDGRMRHNKTEFYAKCAVRKKKPIENKTVIYTEDGHSGTCDEIINLSIGDNFLDHNGTPKKVVEKLFNARRQIMIYRGESHDEPY